MAELVIFGRGDCTGVGADVARGAPVASTSATTTGYVISLTICVFASNLFIGPWRTHKLVMPHVAAFLSGTNSYKMVSLMRRPDAEMAEGVGMWSTLMEAMGFLAVLTNTAIICFTGGALDLK